MPRDHNTASERSGVGVRTKSDVVWLRLNAPPPRMGFCPHDAEASHAPSPARRVPNKGRGVSESTRRGGDREENPPVPVSFSSRARGALQRAWGCAQGPGPFTTFIVLVLKISPSRNCTGLEITPATTQAPPPASLGLGGCRGAARSVTEAG